MSKPTDYFEAGRYFRGGFLLLVFGGVLVLLPVALAFGNGLLSPRALAAVLIVYATGVAVAVVVILRNARARTNISAGRLGAVVGLNDSHLPSIFTIEFGDGSDAEVPLGSLEKLCEP